ncbi:MAG: amidohydrolase family protein [bacterium]|nr:amidohydrolase family protein [bacterium]
MSERNSLDRLIRIGWFTIVTVLIAHVGFVAFVRSYLPFGAGLLFSCAIALILPATRRRLAAHSIANRKPGPAIGSIAFLIAICGANVLILSARPSLPPIGPRAYVGASVITGEMDAPVISDAVVLVDEHRRITAVGQAASLTVPEGHTRIDLTGKFLLPGLINAHGHLMLPGQAAGGAPEMKRFAIPDWVAGMIGHVLASYPGKMIVFSMMKKNAEKTLRGGVTTLRTLGDPHFLDVTVRDEVAADRLLGPRVLASGPILCVTGGHAHQIGQVIDGPIEARKAVRNSLRHRVDQIKIASTGGVSDSHRLGEAGELQMTPEEIRAITDEAHRKSVLVAAHVESASGVKEALRAGVDSIEHGAELDEEAIALFLDNPNSLRGYTTLHPTLSVIAKPIELTEEIREDPALFILVSNGREVARRMTEGFEQAVAGGVKLGVGTDAGIVNHESVWMELKHLVSMGGLSNAEAIHIGTLGTAENIGIADITGSISVGKYADFLVVDANPIEDLSTLAEPRMVVAAGRIID